MLNNQAMEMLLSVLGVLMVKFILQAVALDEMKIERVDCYFNFPWQFESSGCDFVRISFAACKGGKTDRDCQYWKNQGDCTGGVWRSWMRYYCPVSCHVCTPAGNSCLRLHNLKRRQHHSPPLQWDKRLAADSKRWAQYLIRLGYMKHSRGHHGENIYQRMSTKLGTCEESVKAWYDEIKDYNYNRPGFSVKTGHFTQVVWRSTTRVGCGRASVRRRRGSFYYLLTFVVCRYTPPGNMRGGYRANVRRP